MGFPAVTYTFTNSTTADATQVNQDFTDIINGISDTTKNISISALTAAGTATLNGAVTLGASSSNALTVNASLGSTINILTTYSYDIGSDTFGLRSFYLGSNSSAHSTRILGANVSAAWTMTLPNGVPANTNSKILSDTSGVQAFYPASVLPGVTATKTGNYTATSADDLVVCDTTSGAFTVTLPAANAFTGKLLSIINIGTSLANVLTVSRAGSDTINGATSTVLATQYEVIDLISNGSSAWYIVRREYPKGWVSYTPTYTGFGSVTASETFYRRDGDSIWIRSRFLSGTASGVTGSVSFPSGLTLNTSKETLASAIYGIGTNGGSSTTFAVITGSTPGNTLQFGSINASASLAGATDTNIANGGTFSFWAGPIPITNWN